MGDKFMDRKGHTKACASLHKCGDMTLDKFISARRADFTIDLLAIQAERFPTELKKRLDDDENTDPYLLLKTEQIETAYKEYFENKFIPSILKEMESSWNPWFKALEGHGTALMKTFGDRQ